MKTIKYLMGFCALALAMGASSCSSDEPAPDNKPNEVYTEAQKCTGSISVMVKNDDTPESRATSTIFGDVSRYTATCIDNAELWNNSQLALVGYHGLNGEQIGMVQLIDPNNKNKVLSEFNTLDARVNTVKYCKYGDKHYAIIGVDRKGKDGILCGVVAVEMKNENKKQYFYLGETTGEEVLLTPYKVSGISVNSIAWPKGSTVLFTAAGGNDALVEQGDEGLAGFTKFGMFDNGDGNVKLTVLAQKEGLNYRGYCISYDNNDKGLLTYTYRTTVGDDLVWKVGAISRVDKGSLANMDDTFIGDDIYNVETEVYRQPNTREDFGKFTVSSKYHANRNWIFTCAGQGGVKIYHHNKVVDNDNFEGTDKIHTLDLKAFWDKKCVSVNIINPDGKLRMYAACAAGCYKTDLTLDGVNITAEIVPVGRRVPAVYEDGTRVSTNYVSSFNNKRVYVAGGYEGFYALNWDSDEFVPAKD